VQKRQRVGKIWNVESVVGWHVQDFGQKSVRKFAELRINCPWQKCNPETLVSSDISFMRLFTGVP